MDMKPHFVMKEAILQILGEKSSMTLTMMSCIKVAENIQRNWLRFRVTVIKCFLETSKSYQLIIRYYKTTKLRKCSHHHKDKGR